MDKNEIESIIKDYLESNLKIRSKQLTKTMIEIELGILKDVPFYDSFKTHFESISKITLELTKNGNFTTL